MEQAYILHLLTPEKNVSPLDVNMAVDAGYDLVFPYTNVTLNEVEELVQEAVFSRGAQGVKGTAIFIGGRDLELADNMFMQAKAAMCPPFAASILVDPAGSATTGAALIALVQHWYQQQTGKSLEGSKIAILGGTGPVGICAGTIASRCKAQVISVSHRGKRAAQQVVDRFNERFQVELVGGNGSTVRKKSEILGDATIILNTAKSGVQVLTAHELKNAPKITLLGDLNALAPAGIEGVGVDDNGTLLMSLAQPTRCIGAHVVDELKNRVRRSLLERMRYSENAIYLDFQQAFVEACGILAG